MGNTSNVTADSYPKQGTFLGKRMRVCFRYNLTDTQLATCVRDDAEEPWRTIFHLDDGRFVLSNECQYSPC